MTALSHIHSFATITLSLAISFITTSIWNLYPMSVFPYLHCPDILSHPSLAPHFCISLSKVIFILLWPWAATASVWFYSKIQILDELEIKQNKQNKKKWTTKKLTNQTKSIKQTKHYFCTSVFSMKAQWYFCIFFILLYLFFPVFFLWAAIFYIKSWIYRSNNILPWYCLSPITCLFPVM